MKTKLFSECNKRLKAEELQAVLERLGARTGPWKQQTHNTRPYSRWEFFRYLWAEGLVVPTAWKDTPCPRVDESAVTDELLDGPSYSLFQVFPLLQILERNTTEIPYIPSSRHPRYRPPDQCRPSLSDSVFDEINNTTMLAHVVEQLSSNVVLTPKFWESSACIGRVNHPEEWDTALLAGVPSVDKLQGVGWQLHCRGDRLSPDENVAELLVRLGTHTLDKLDNTTALSLLYFWGEHVVDLYRLHQGHEPRWRKGTSLQPNPFWTVSQGEPLQRILKRMNVVPEPSMRMYVEGKTDVFYVREILRHFMFDEAISLAAYGGGIALADAEPDTCDKRKQKSASAASETAMLVMASRAVGLTEELEGTADPWFIENPSVCMVLRDRRRPTDPSARAVKDALVNKMKGLRGGDTDWNPFVHVVTLKVTDIEFLLFTDEQIANAIGNVNVTATEVGTARADHEGLAPMLKEQLGVKTIDKMAYAPHLLPVLHDQLKMGSYGGCETILNAIYEAFALVTLPETATDKEREEQQQKRNVLGKLTSGRLFPMPYTVTRKGWPVL